LLLGLQFLFQLRDAAILQLAALFRFVLTLGLIKIGRWPAQHSRSFWTCNGVFLFSHWAFLALNSSAVGSSLGLGQVLRDRDVVLLLERRLLDLQLHDLPGDVVQLRGHGVDLRADHGAGLVH
jgi:hypothetical protein